MDINNLPIAVVLAKQLNLVDTYSKAFDGERIEKITVARKPLRKAEMKEHLGLNPKEEKQLEVMFEEFETKITLFLEEIKTNIVKQIKIL